MTIQPAEYAPRVPLDSNGVAAVDEEIAIAKGEFAAAAMLSAHLDPILSEVLRLRCAWFHDCRHCGSVRLVEAQDAGMDEGMVDQIRQSDPSSLTERQQVAIRLADALIVDPARADATLVTDVRAHFTDEEISEILFDVMKASGQKVLVALRLEPPVRGVNALRFGNDGRSIIGEAALALPALA